MKKEIELKSGKFRKKTFIITNEAMISSSISDDLNDFDQFDGKIRKILLNLEKKGFELEINEFWNDRSEEWEYRYIKFYSNEHLFQWEIRQNEIYIEPEFSIYLSKTIEYLFEDLDRKIMIKILKDLAKELSNLFGSYSYKFNYIYISCGGDDYSIIDFKRENINVKEFFDFQK